MNGEKFIGRSYVRLGKTVAQLQDYSHFFESIDVDNVLEYNEPIETTIDGTQINTTQKGYYRPKATISFYHKLPDSFSEIIRILNTREFVIETFDPHLQKFVIRLMRMEDWEKGRFNIWAGRYKGVTTPKFNLVSKLAYRTVDESGNFIDYDFLDSVDQFDAYGNRTSHDERIN